MRVDNFELIKPLLRFDNEGDFYMIQILKRRKENPDMKKDVKYIDDFFVYSSDMEDWDELKEKVVKKCLDNNARAYIRLNRRNDKKVALETMRFMTAKVANGDFKNFKTAYMSVCGKNPSEPNKRWVIDVDVNDYGNFLEDIIIGHLTQIRPHIDKYITTLPTVNGKHIITKPFDLGEFKKYFDIHVHKDNPTLLYY